MKNNFLTKVVSNDNYKNNNENKTLFSNIMNYSLNKSFSSKENQNKGLDTNRTFRIKCI